MKLKTALEIGIDCGLETVGECVFNIKMHAGSLFSYNDIGKELTELSLEYDHLKCLCKNAENKDAKVTLVFLNEEIKLEDDEILIKTNKFNHMISSFQCDFSLAKEGKHKLLELDKHIQSKNEKILKDIELLEELEWMLRNNRAEIRIITKQEAKK